MPRWDRDSGARGPVVKGFTERGFVVDGGVYEALLLTPERADGWIAPPLAQLAIEHLEPLLSLQPSPEFLIIGTGPSMGFPLRALVRALEERGIGVEAMDSRAAARTWGMLRGEERWIGAALMPLG
ncbi:MAG TPA: MTH938/NDUFAF3 family protein [Allosphingosinicella sp.]|nr:MTH938/NDUFAF3 family protein [Allosphingosinicella sp.]